MYSFETIFVVVITFFATLAAADCGLTLKKAVAPIKAVFKGIGNMFNNNESEGESDAKEEKSNQKRRTRNRRPKDL
jgi:predicted nucleic acid-binding Zn ribbon protein